MKNILIIVLVAIYKTVFSQVSYTDAVTYNDYIVNEQNAIGEAIINLNAIVNSVADTTHYKEQVESAYNQLKRQVAQSVNKINAMPVYDGNVEFLDASKALFNFYQSTIIGIYSELVRYILGSVPSVADYENLMIAFENMSAEEVILDNNFAKAQAAFAQKYNFELIDNALQNDINGLQDDE